jgi:hypothetical protein
MNLAGDLGRIALAAPYAATRPAMIDDDRKALAVLI